MANSSYKLIAKKGQGGMAEVFKAVKSGPDGFSKTVALKRILPFHSDQVHFMRMLSTEAKIHSYLSHPNIIQILDFFEDEGQYSIVLEYIDGKNVKEILTLCNQKKNILPWQACLFIMSEILKGLQYAHTKNGPDGPLNIIHRDVSPHNILISYNGEVKLSDFGIARAKIQRDETESGVLKGKYRYLSPEQILNEPLMPSSDIFSAGVTLYEMLSLSHPFGEQQEYQTLQKILDQPHAPLKTKIPSIDSEISDIIDRALQKKPEDRFATAKEFHDHLMEFQDHSWITHGHELMATLIQNLVPENEKKEAQIDQTSKLAQPIVTQQSLFQVDSGKKQGRWIWLGILLIILPIGFAYLISKPQSIPQPTVAAPQKMETKPPINAAPMKNKEIKKTFTKPQGTIIFSGPHDTHVYINGKSVGTIPVSEQNVPEGSYTILLDRGEKGKQSKTVQVIRKEVTQIAWE